MFMVICFYMNIIWDYRILRLTMHGIMFFIHMHNIFIHDTID